MSRHKPEEYQEWTQSYSKRRAERGEVRVAVWVPTDRADDLKAYAAKLREKAGTKRDPPPPPKATKHLRQKAIAPAATSSAHRRDVTQADIAAFARRHGITPAKIGRNQPCPCGSGKKYKRCCGTNA